MWEFLVVPEQCVKYAGTFNALYWLVSLSWTSQKHIRQEGSVRVFPGSGIWPKYSAEFGKTLTGYGIWLLPRGAEFAKTWAWMRNENDKWYSGYWWKKSDAGFLVKREWKCGFRTPSFQTLYSKITVWEAFAISLPLILGPVYVEVGDPR